MKKFFDVKMFLFDLVKWTGWLPVVLDLRLKRIFVKDGKITKKEKGLLNGVYIIVCNHRSYRDPVILLNTFWTRRVCFVATKELFENRFWNFMFRNFGCVKVDKIKNNFDVFKDIKEKINDGHLVALFPEGRVVRNKTKMEDFHQGAVVFAGLNNIPILPVYIEKRKSWYNRQKVFVGEKILVKFDDMTCVNKFTRIISDKENELRKISEERNERNN